MNPLEKNLRILVIDDARAIHEDFRKILRGPGLEGTDDLDAASVGLFGAAQERRHAACFEIDSAFQGQDGLRMVQRAISDGRPYAMVFVDVRMPPGWDGIETIQHIWTVDPDLQVVVCTAYSDYSWDQMIGKLGYSDRLLILKKPFDNVEVLQLATALTEKWRLAQEERKKLGSLEKMVTLRTGALQEAMGQLKRSLEARERAEAELRKSEELFRTLSASSPIGIWLADTTGRCLYCNARWEAMSGLGGDQSLGDRWQDAIHPGERADVAAAWRTEATAGRRFTREMRLTPGEGEPAWALMQSSPIVDAQNGITGHVVTFEDITERKRAQDNLRMAKEAAEQAARLKSHFLANVTHEIRTPMNGVIGMTDLLLDSEMTQQQRECAETVRDSAETLMTIINDILDFSKLEERTLTFEARDFDLRQVVEGVLEMLAARAQAKGLELCTASIAGDVPRLVRGDSGRLRQILGNLIGNAIKFTPDGEVAVRVARQSEAGTQVVLRFEVHDTGTGIAPEVRERLFQPFTQGDGGRNRVFGGTGLGLAISKQLVGMMHGDIGVENASGRGSIFWFTAQFDVRGAAPRPVSTLHGVRCLIVEENRTHRAILAEELNAWGLTAQPVSSAGEALAALHQAASDGHAFEAVLIDTKAASADGGALVRAIGADPRLARPRIIGLAPPATVSLADLAQQSGIDDCLPKPVRQSRLVESLSQLLRRQGRTSSAA